MLQGGVYVTRGLILAMVRTAKVYAKKNPINRFVLEKKISIPPPPPKVPINTEMMRYFKKYNTSIMQFSRLTIELREMDDLIKVSVEMNIGWVWSAS